MDIIGWIIGILGIVIGVGIAVRQHSAAKGREERLLVQVGNVVRSLSATLAQTSGEVEGGILGARVQYADVNGDGNKELVVDYFTGPHASVLDVYGFRDMEFVHLGGLSSGTPCGFDIGDFDGDGKLEISSTETDWEAGKCYAEAPRLRVIHKWTGNGFVDIKKEPLPPDGAISNSGNS